MKKLYIAYGSNLNLRQMASRCPSASVYAHGLLNNWELVFRGSPLNSHATIRKKTGCQIPVLVWSIGDRDESRLDRYEGYPYYYFKRNIMVQISDRKKKAMVYIMNEDFLPGQPSDQYVKSIRQGYRDNGFDLSVFNEALEMNFLECR